MEIPPLRERREDIPVLLTHFIDHFAAENNKKVEGISSEARDLLMKYDYPGNVRELENIIERGVVITRESLITVKDLPLREEFHEPDDDAKDDDALRDGGALRDALEELERKLLVEAMEKAGGQQAKAAESLGVNKRMLRYKLKKYGVKSS
jgi:two-component system NtrC family response regulator